MRERIKTVAALPDLRSLHERHFALMPDQCLHWYGAACVSLHRHHQPPTTSFALQHHDDHCKRELVWESPSVRLSASQNNRDDATRDAAYLVAIAAAEDHLGLVAVDRMETRTGADYLLVARGTSPDDHEDSIRLEVAGQDRGGEGALRSRLKLKVNQLRKADACRPGLAAVVGFQRAVVLFADLDVDDPVPDQEGDAIDER